MIGVVIALLLAATVAGVLVARGGASGSAGLAWAAVPATLVGAAAVVALAAPAATGFGLAAVRVAAVLAAMAGGSALVTAAFALAGATGQDDPAADSEADTAPAGGADGPTPDGSEGSSGGDESRRAEGEPSGEPGDGPSDEPVPASPLRGGLAIGVLERAAIAVCVLANFGGGLAVIVAAKGLARYPELRHPGAAEQFIIGTFVSVLWAVACAGVAVAVGR